MSVTDPLGSPPPPPLSPGALRLVEIALHLPVGTAQLGVNHWLLALVERHGPMAEALVTGIEAKTQQEYAGKRTAARQVGDVL